MYFVYPYAHPGTRIRLYGVLVPNVFCILWCRLLESAALESVAGFQPWEGHVVASWESCATKTHLYPYGHVERKSRTWVIHDISWSQRSVNNTPSVTSSPTIEVEFHTTLDRLYISRRIGSKTNNGTHCGVSVMGEVEGKQVVVQTYLVQSTQQPFQAMSGDIWHGQALRHKERKEDCIRYNINWCMVIRDSCFINHVSYYDASVMLAVSSTDIVPASNQVLSSTVFWGCS